MGTRQRLTRGLDVDHGALGTLSGHGVPRAVRVLDPLGSLTVELALVGGLQVEDGEAEGGAPQLVQPHLPQALPLGVLAAGVKHEIAAQGDDLRRLLAPSLPEPGHRQVAVLERLRGHLTRELQGVLLHLVQSLGHGRGLQGVGDHCNTETSREPGHKSHRTSPSQRASQPPRRAFHPHCEATGDPGWHRNRRKKFSAWIWTAIFFWHLRLPVWYFNNT